MRQCSENETQLQGLRDASWPPTSFKLAVILLAAETQEASSTHPRMCRVCARRTAGSAHVLSQGNWLLYLNSSAFFSAVCFRTGANSHIAYVLLSNRLLILMSPLVKVV